MWGMANEWPGFYVHEETTQTQEFGFFSQEA